MAADIAYGTIYEILGLKCGPTSQMSLSPAQQGSGLMELTEEWIALESRIPSADSTDRRKRRRTQKTIERYKTAGTEVGSSGG